MYNTERASGHNAPNITRHNSYSLPSSNSSMRYFFHYHNCRKHPIVTPLPETISHLLFHISVSFFFHCLRPISLHTNQLSISSTSDSSRDIALFVTSRNRLILLLPGDISGRRDNRDRDSRMSPRKNRKKVDRMKKPPPVVPKSPSKKMPKSPSKKMLGCRVLPASSYSSTTTRGNFQANEASHHRLC